MSIFYEGPNFFASSQTCWLIWPKTFARSWQHCEESKMHQSAFGRIQTESSGNNSRDMVRGKDTVRSWKSSHFVGKRA
jgi:hypothetical protein